MDREALWPAVHGVARVGHDLAAKSLSSSCHTLKLVKIQEHL